MPDFQFWNERWLNNQIGFHQLRPHPALVKYADLFKDHQNILVPLCGKSLDMIFLKERGHHVIGVEFSEMAIQDFIKENHLTMTRTEEGPFAVFRCDGLTLYQGDFFDLSRDHLKNVTAAYDRASMVAFDPNERRRYADHLKREAQDLQKLLVVVFNYGAVAGGPPYSVINEEIEALYADLFELKLLQEESFPLRDPLKERGATFEKEMTWEFSRQS